MSLIMRTLALVHIVAKRLYAQLGLAILTIVGLVASISLVVCIPMYADAVYHRVYLEKVSNSSASTQGGETRYVPFSFTYQYQGVSYGKLEWEDVQAVDQFIATSSATVLGLPNNIFVRFFSTDTAALFPSSDQASGFNDPKLRLGWINLGFMSGLEDQAQIVEGKFPAVADPTPDSLIEVLVSLPLANQLGLHAGENFTVLMTSNSPNGAGTNAAVVIRYPVRIAGIWQPKDANSPYWTFNPSNLIDVFLVPEGTYANRISPAQRGEINTGVWYLVMDGTSIHTSDVNAFVSRISRLNNQVSSLLPNIQVTNSPSEALYQYQKAATQLTILLYAFSVPILGLILAFISLVVSLSLERKRNEIAVMRSRGATALQMLGSIGLESIVLGLIALGISLPVAILITQIISQTRSFMDFSVSSPLQISLTQPVLIIGVVTVIGVVVVTLIPAVSVVRQTIISYKQERASQTRKPVWQRFWLDVLLLIPAGYGTYLLSKQGSILIAGSNDPLGNPLLFLVPALVVLAVALLLLRVIPYIMAAIGWLAGRTHNVGLLLAARQLSRSPGYYNTPMLILVFTLSLSTYTASLAQTFDQHLTASANYKVGADMKFTDVGETTQQSTFGTLANQTNTTPEYVFIPVSEYLQIPGVLAATRVGSFPAIYDTNTGSTQSGKFYGIDRVDFPKVAYWQNDFAPQSLGALMNALAANPDGVLVSGQFMGNNGLEVGDKIQLTVPTDVKQVEMTMKIVGSFNLFPTWYPVDVPLFVGNLDDLYAQAGGDSPYQIWLKTTPNIDTTQLGNIQIRELNFRIVTWAAARPQIQQDQLRPEQQGLFGFLFIGFAAAAIFTVVGFFLYALFSYQRRFIELGILRAGGLSRGQMAANLAYELICLILFGSLVGTGLGILISSQFIPYLQIGTDNASRFPPFQVIIAWSAIYRIYALFGFLFIVILGVLVVRLQRMKIFQAIKLGETI